MLPQGSGFGTDSSEEIKAAHFVSEHTKYCINSGSPTNLIHPKLRLIPSCLVEKLSLHRSAKEFAKSGDKFCHVPSRHI